MTEDPRPVDPPEGRRFVRTRDFFKALHDAGLLPEYPMVQRVVIDCQARNGAVLMYVDRIPASALLEIPALMTAPAEPVGEAVPQWTAHYFVHYVRHSMPFPSLSEAREFLDEGSQQNSLSPERIVDPDGRDVVPMFEPVAPMNDPQDQGEAARRRLGIDGTAGDAQDVPHPFVPNTKADSPWCLACGLSRAFRGHLGPS